MCKVLTYVARQHGTSGRRVRSNGRLGAVGVTSRGEPGAGGGSGYRSGSGSGSSSPYISHPLAICFAKMLSIMCWKVAGEFVRPKNITVSSNNPYFVVNAAFHQSSSAIRILL